MNKKDNADEVTFEEKFNDYGEYENNTGENYKISNVDSAPNFEYEYEDDEDKDNKEIVKKTTTIMLLIILIVIIILILIKACSGSGVKKDSGGKKENENPTAVTLEEKLLKAGKNYFTILNTELPDTKATCNTVSLDVLSQLEYVGEEFSTCDKNKTYVKVCLLNNADLQYVPVMECDGSENDTVFGEWKKGSEKDLTPDESDVKFMYNATYVDSSKSIYGSIEEFWKDEIPYENYKTVGVTNYYRYRDKEYQWTLKKRLYYPGDVLNASDEDTYYKKSPANGYVNKTSKKTGYLWERLNSKEYYPSNGGYSIDEPAGYPFHDEKDNVTYTVYYTRTWNEVSKPYSVAPQKMYLCADPNNTKNVIKQYDDCSENATDAYRAGYTHNLGTIYTCNSGVTQVNQSSQCLSCPEGSALRGDKSSCGNFSNWSGAKIDSVNFTVLCDTSTDTCKSEDITVRRWYRADSEVIGSKSPTGESPYYVKSPEDGAVKDEDSATTVYKWYKLVDAGTTSDYSATSPAQDAVKTNNSKWGSWSKYSTTKPKTISGSREIQKRVKVKLRKLVSEAANSTKQVSDEYLTEEELISKLNKLGYQVNDLGEAEAIGEIKILSQLYYRDRI